MRRVIVLAVVATLAFPLLAQAQSMAEAARQAKKERKGTAKVYTADDLSKLRDKGLLATGDAAAPAAEAPDTAASPATPGAKKAEKSEDELRAEKKAALEKQLSDEEGVLEQLRKLNEDAERELADSTNVGMIGGRHAAVMQAIEQNKQRAAEAQAKIEAIREEARRAGIALSR